MDKQRIEFLLKVDAPIEISSYALSVADILAPPSWLRPIKRYKWRRDFDKRVNFVLAEYVKNIMDEVENLKTNQ